MIHNFSGSTARDRDFVNMRTTFMKNDKLIRESKSSGEGSDDIYKPKWPLFESLTFFRKSTAQASSISNLPSSSQSCFCNESSNNTQETLSHPSETHDVNFNILAKLPILPKPVTESYMASDSSCTEQTETTVTNISDNLYFDENLHVSDNYLFIIYYYKN